MPLGNLVIFETRIGFGHQKMKFPKRVPQVIVITVVIGAFWCSSRVQMIMNRLRITNDVTGAQPSLVNAPPLVAFTTIAAGGFRGLVADFIFLRMQAQQDKKNFFEIAQLASWVVKLQPRFTGATAFLSWNMAYNISIMFNDPDDRWRWIQHGIELLRDTALVYNPLSTTLYRELGWIYQHKIGQSFDDAHLYYKFQLAQEVTRILGLVKGSDWHQLAGAPTDYDDLMVYLNEASPVFRKILDDNDITLAQLELDFRKNGDFNVEIRRELTSVSLLNIVENYLRARWLRATLKLDPRLVVEIIESYGPLDFRLPASHALYWAFVGLKRSPNESDLSCERMVFQSLKRTFFAGTLVHLSEASMYTTPNFDVADALQTAYLDAISTHKNNKMIVAGYEHFLIDAIVLFYIFDRKSKAEEFLQDARNTPLLRDKPIFRKKLDEFVLVGLSGEIDALSRDKALALIQALILHSHTSLAYGKDSQSTNFELMARKIYGRYKHKLSGSNNTRLNLPDYALIKSQCEKLFNQNSLSGSSSDHLTLENPLND